MDFATLHMDTYKIVNLLREKGYTKKEAEGFIEAIQEITLSGVATKEDIQNVRNEISDLRTGTQKDFMDLRAEMLKFQVIQTVAIIGVMVALFQIF